MLRHPLHLTDGAGRPHQAHGCAGQCQWAPGVACPMASNPLCLLGSPPPILSCSVSSANFFLVGVAQTLDWLLFLLWGAAPFPWRTACAVLWEVLGRCWTVSLPNIRPSLLVVLGLCGRVAVWHFARGKDVGPQQSLSVCTSDHAVALRAP